MVEEIEGELSWMSMDWLGVTAGAAVAVTGDPHTVITRDLARAMARGN